jgi:hypothetical protein
MARYDDGHGVRGVGPANGAGCARFAQLHGNVLVRSRLAKRNGKHKPQRLLLEGTQDGPIDGYVKLARFALKVRGKLLENGCRLFRVQFDVIVPVQAPYAIFSGLHMQAHQATR